MATPCTSPTAASSGPAIIKTMVEADGRECSVDDFELVNNNFYHTDALIDGKADVDDSRL